MGVITRRKPRGEYRLAEKLLTKLLTLIEILVADKGFDVNEFYKLLKKIGIRGIIPVKTGVHRGFFRNFMKKYFRTKTYHRRSIIESTISRLKRLYGNFLYSRNTTQQRKEVLLRLIADNLKIGKQTQIFN